MSIFEPILRALNEAGVRYVIAGGLATVLHGHARFTADLDLIVDLAPKQALKAVETLSSLGLQPRVPAKAEEFADPGIRRRWIQEKGMRVFSMWDPEDPLRVVDLFVEHPVGFQDLWSQSRLAQLESTPVRIASLPHLIHLKRLAGRPLDLDDIEKLEEIQRSRDEDAR